MTGEELLLALGTSFSILGSLAWGYWQERQEMRE